ncbi:MAG: thioredoxin family protein [Firmicutes bacterium]|nr:thioredoxin family protein [Bacillota bacterium]
MGEKVIVDIVTLDAIQCAACTYMKESVTALPESIQKHIVATEWTIKNKEGIAKFMEHGVKVLPSIVINGDVVFESIVPTLEELLEALSARAHQELQAEIQKLLEAEA